MPFLKYSWKKYIAECLGTFLLVLFGTGAMIMNEHTDGLLSHLGVSLTFGIIVTVAIIVFGKVSGAHINPAVSIVFWFLKKLNGKDLFLYLIAQFIGAVMASGLWYLQFPEKEYYGDTLPYAGIMATSVIELVMTYILVLVILVLAHGDDLQKKYLGIAVGGIVALEAFIGGPLTGASMNPARSLGPAVFSGELSSLWIYILFPIVGAIMALGTWRVVLQSDD